MLDPYFFDTLNLVDNIYTRSWIFIDSTYFQTFIFWFFSPESFWEQNMSKSFSICLNN